MAASKSTSSFFCGGWTGLARGAGARQQTTTNLVVLVGLVEWLGKPRGQLNESFVVMLIQNLRVAPRHTGERHMVTQARDKSTGTAGHQPCDTSEVANTRTPWPDPAPAEAQTAPRLCPWIGTELSWIPRRSASAAVVAIQSACTGLAASQRATATTAWTLGCWQRRTSASAPGSWRAAQNLHWWCENCCQAPCAEMLSGTWPWAVALSALTAPTVSTGVNPCPRTPSSCGQRRLQAHLEMLAHRSAALFLRHRQQGKKPGGFLPRPCRKT